MPEPIYVQLTWEDPHSGDLRQPIYTVPIAIGRELEYLPEKLGNQAVSRVELADNQISRFHSLITVVNQQLYVTDKSSNGTFLNGRKIGEGSQLFSSNDTLRIGPYKIIATLMQDLDENATQLSRDAVNIPIKEKAIAKNNMLIWVVGVLVLVLMGLGGGFLVQLILENSRPQVPSNEFPNNN